MVQKDRKGKQIFSSTAQLPGVCGREIIEAIDKAEKTIDIATTHFRRQDIAKALENAMTRGVRVRILLDMQEYHPVTTVMKDARYDEGLAEIGAKVKYKCYANKWTYQRALQLHCKYMIVDNRTVLTGSLNWSANSELKTTENLMQLDRPSLAREYLKRFEMKWNYGAGTFPEVLQTLKNNQGTITWFKPIALTGEQVDRVMKD